MSDRLIPRGDLPFSAKLECFARAADKEPGRFAMSPEEAAELLAVSERLRSAIRESQNPSTQSAAATREKKTARGEAERIYKRFTARMRVTDGIDPIAKRTAGMTEPAERRRSRAVPDEPPDLRFERALHEGSSAAPMHELSFRALAGMSKAKPRGAARIEIYAALVGRDEELPRHPGSTFGGPARYLRSFTKSPIRITPPMASEPMLVVYWGRWTDSSGEQGPWSKTIVSRVEGHSPHVRIHKETGGVGQRLPDVTEADRLRSEQRYSVMVQDARFEYPQRPKQIETTPEPKRLEGPEAA